MKYIILLGDGMGDYPVEALDGRTPLAAAHVPWMRRLAARAHIHNVLTVPDGLPPGSDVCNMGLLGYNAADKYTGRAPIEAAGAGVPMAADEVAYRCNLVTVQNERMQDYSAGHITTEEAHALMSSLRQALAQDGLTFHPGISYRHLLVWRDGPVDIRTQPPHDIAEKNIAPYLPSGPRAAEVLDLMERSKAILAEHPVNRARMEQGKAPATQIWLWGQGKALQLPTFKTLYNLTGGVITAVDLVRGLGRLADLDTPEVEGATGFIDTNYEGKIEAACAILKNHPFVYVHIEAPDECGHMGDAQLKVKAIEDFDERVVGPMWQFAETLGEPYRLLIAMDHRTPVTTRCHTTETVPLAYVEGPTGPLAEEHPFDESILTSLPETRSYQLIRRILSQN